MLENVYSDSVRADSYAKLEFPGTYYLAYRDIPEIIAKHVSGKNAVDFGCGAGRSTRFLKKMGFDVNGIDISPDMIKKAKEFDPEGSYYVVQNTDFEMLQKGKSDLVLSMFTFDNIGTSHQKLQNLMGLKKLLNSNGRIISLVSSPDIYMHEWVSFSTKDYPENKNAKCGDIVKIVMLDVEDSRPVLDVIWPHDDYMNLFKKAELQVEAIYKPLGKNDEPFNWVNETIIAPWVIYVLRKTELIK